MPSSPARAASSNRRLHSLLSLVLLVAMSSSLARAFVTAPAGHALRRASNLGASRPRRLSMTRRAALQADGKVGWIGLGYMGNGMVRRLLERGDDVVVWNRSPEKAQKLQAEYSAERVTIAASPREAVKQASSGYIFSMLSTPAAARAVFDGPDGVLAGITAGKALVDCATLEVKDMQEFDKAVKAKGGRFLEAPVSGSKVPAEQGQLIFLSAGDEGIYKAVQPQLEAMGKAHYYLGDTGKGTEMKLVVNMVMASMLASLSEGLTLADRSGLKREDVVSILDLGAMANPMFHLKGPKILADDHAPNFPLKHAQKDLAFALALAGSLGVECKTAAAADVFYRQALAAGDGELDFSAVARAVDAAAKARK